jgi:hypothetical protein
MVRRNIYLYFSLFFSYSNVRLYYSYLRLSLLYKKYIYSISAKCKITKNITPVWQNKKSLPYEVPTIAFFFFFWIFNFFSSLWQYSNKKNRSGVNMVFSFLFFLTIQTKNMNENIFVNSGYFKR